MSTQRVYEPPRTPGAAVGNRTPYCGAPVTYSTAAAGSRAAGRWGFPHERKPGVGEGGAAAPRAVHPRPRTYRRLGLVRSIKFAAR
ncbi:hypothetical protein GCM10010279_64060 [Streptomyces mutabilis]|nr:hypothetical protein GCM10010279_64060 [Streptomyces mutabilis]